MRVLRVGSSAATCAIRCLSSSSDGGPFAWWGRSLSTGSVGAKVVTALPFVLGDVFRLKAGERARRLPGYGPGVCGSPLRFPNRRYLIYGTYGMPGLAQSVRYG